ncbi:MAG: hypothetical protein EOP49_51020, partial [Sphingobacteriales bacterium]
YVVQTDRRKELYDFLRTKEIYAQVHYIPVHLMPYYRQLGWKKGDFPLAEAYYERCLSLPMYPTLTHDEQTYVIDQLKQIPYLRDVKAAGYEITEAGKRLQPLLIDIEHLAGKPLLTVMLDNKEIFRETLETGRYQFEAPMAAVIKPATGVYQVLFDGQLIQQGKVNRKPSRRASYADYVDTKIGTAHSRWMIGPGPWMPFGMVKIGPDNQNDGWQAGYDPTFESVGAFSHVHEWTMGGLGMLPVNGPLKIKVGDQRSAPGEGYRSAIDKTTEEAPLGYYKVDLTDYNIKAELTATTRASFQRYTYPKGTDSRVMIDLQTPSEYKYKIPEVSLKKVSDRRIEGYSKQVAPDVWN